jgi:hypothetical protein
MANTQAQFGFKHIGYLSGAGPDYQQQTRAILKTNLTAIGFGDPVQRTNATSPYIVRGDASTTQPIEGIFVGCTYQVSGQAQVWSPFWPGVTAASDPVAYVIDAPNALFLAATLLTAIVSSNIGNVVNYTTGTPSIVGGGYSIATLDQATLSTAGGTTMSAMPFKVVSLYQGIGNGADAASNFNWVVVKFNNQIFNTNTGW